MCFECINNLCFQGLLADDTKHLDSLILEFIFTTHNHHLWSVVAVLCDVRLFLLRFDLWCAASAASISLSLSRRIWVEYSGISDYRDQHTETVELKFVCTLRYASKKFMPVARSIFGPLSWSFCDQWDFTNEISSSALLNVQPILLCVSGVDYLSPTSPN